MDITSFWDMSFRSDLIRFTIPVIRFGMKAWRKKVAQFQPDVLLLPINGNKPERKVAGNMSASEAAAFGKAVGYGIVIPHHYHMFEFNTEDPENFAKAAEKEGIPYQILQIGESIEIKINYETEEIFWAQYRYC